jgi:hypothetical protein
LSRGLAIASSLVLAVLAAGCESSQDKSARLEKNGGKAFEAKGLDVKHQNPDVKVTSTTVLQDKNGAATVVVLHNSAPTWKVNVPISIDVLGRARKSVFKNDAPGLEPSLVAAPLIKPKGDFIWVNDQVAANAPAKSVAVKVGRGPARPPSGKIPELVVSPAKLRTDPVSGVEAVGTVTNKSKVVQRSLIVYCVAIRGSKVVAAGRSGIQRLLPGKKKSYHVYFIGNPAGGRLSLTAPPTVLQ